MQNEDFWVTGLAETAMRSPAAQQSLMMGRNEPALQHFNRLFDEAVQEDQIRFRAAMSDGHSKRAGGAIGKGVVETVFPNTWREAALRPNARIGAARADQDLALTRERRDWIAATHAGRVRAVFEEAVEDLAEDRTGTRDAQP